jgi:hypothetical protein
MAEFTHEAMKAHRTSRLYLYSFFNLGAKMGMVGKGHAPDALPPRSRPGTRFTVG